MFLPLFLLLLSFVYANALSPQSVSLTLTNLASRPVSLFWVSVDNNNLVSQSAQPIVPSATANINSYQGHSFVVSTLAMPKEWNVKQLFTMGTLDLKVFVYEDNEGIVLRVESKLNRVQEIVRDAIVQCGKDKPYNVINTNDFEDVQCAVNRAIEQTTPLLEQYSAEVRLRKDIAKALRNYTCADTNSANSQELGQITWFDQDHGKAYRVRQMFDRRGVKINLVDDFITPEECAELRLRALPSLTRAAVTGDDGVAVISNSRRASAAMVNPRRDGSDILDKLQDRVIAYANSFTEYNLEYHGQEVTA
jgi:hypothetical protein